MLTGRFALLFSVCQCRLQSAVILQCQLLGAGTLIKTGGLQGGDDLRLGQVQAIGDGVGGGLAALGEGGADQREEGGFVAVRHDYGRLLPHIQADDALVTLGAG